MIRRPVCFLTLLFLAATALADGPAHDAQVGVDSAALRATVFGTPIEDRAPLPARVPVAEINLRLPWTQPVPEIFWFNRKLRVWLSAQPGAAPLAIVIAGTGASGNTEKLAVLRAALYGAGYHVLTMPSPTYPGFIVPASSTGVAGDLLQDSQDLYAALQVVVGRLPARVQVTEIDILGYSLGGAHAAVVKSIDATEGKLHIRRAVMINPPVSLFATIGRFDQMFATSIGTGEAAIDRLYRKLYARLANAYRASNQLEIDETFVLAAAGGVLKTDRELSAAIALAYRLSMLDMFFAGDLYAGTGAIVDPDDPPDPGESLDHAWRLLRAKPFSEYLDRVFLPYYLKQRPGSSRESLLAGSRLDIIADELRTDPDYYAQTNSDELILDAGELAWLKATLGPRIQVYDQGGHLGNLGSTDQIADMLDMVAGRWPRTPEVTREGPR